MSLEGILMRLPSRDLAASSRVPLALCRSQRPRRNLSVLGGKVFDNAHVFHSPIVTSDLARSLGNVDHCQGESGERKNAAFGLKSFVLKILSSNPLGLKILRTLFAEPAPVAAFERGREGEGYLPTKFFPN